MTSPGSPSVETPFSGLEIQDKCNNKAVPTLMQLPREIRDQIYRYLIPTGRSWAPLCINERCDSINLDSEDNRDIRWRINSRGWGLGFFYTCRQILHEASVLFYKENWFDFLPTAEHYLPEAFKQQSVLKSTQNVKRIKHLRLTIGIGRLDPEQDKAREEKVKEGKAVAVRKLNPEEERGIKDHGWLMVAEIPKVLQSFVDANVHLATLRLGFQFLYLEDDSYYKALCDELNTNFGVLKALYDLDVRGQITMRGRCWPENIEVYRSIQGYACNFAEWGGYSVTQARYLDSGEWKFVWYIRPEHDASKLERIRESLRNGEEEPMITYRTQVG